MRVLITEVTRMSQGSICVAGINMKTDQRVRPVLRGSEQWKVNQSAVHGGPLEPGAIIDFPNERPHGSSPEVEDVLVDPRLMARVAALEPDAFFEHMSRVAVENWREAFGPDLQEHTLSGRKGRTCRVMPGKGNCSLVIAPIPAGATIAIDGKDSVFFFHDALRIPVTDLRLRRADAETLDRRAVDRFAEALLHTLGGFMAMGLTRLYAPGRSEAKAHWLQVNALYVPGMDISLPRVSVLPTSSTVAKARERLQEQVATNQRRDAPAPDRPHTAHVPQEQQRRPSRRRRSGFAGLVDRLFGRG